MERLRWLEREAPLAIAGVAVPFERAVAYAERLETSAGDSSNSVQTFIAGRRLIVLSTDSVLPWVDEAVWLGSEGPLWCSTTLRPSWPPELVVRAARAQSDGTHVVALPAGVFVTEPPQGRFDPAQLALDLRLLAGEATDGAGT